MRTLQEYLWMNSRPRDGSRHQLIILIDRVAKHHPLVAGAADDAHGDILVFIDAGMTAQVLQSKPWRALSYPMMPGADYGLEINVSFGSDFAGDDHQSGRGESLAGGTTRLKESSVRRASRIASEIWSAILSGWPSVTDSEVNK